ncbi:MAG: hypothetical protein OEZ43_00450 [Gammaproteobacteria bacterium]|nr:hypothetical protein [Gammaproteobacteria bacterium]
MTNPSIRIGLPLIGYLVFIQILLPAYAGSDTGNELKQEMHTSKIQIEKIIGDAICQTDEQCKSVAMGNKACGGPAFYLTYSQLNTDEKKLTSLAQHHQELARQYNQITGMMSDCMVVMPPPLKCVEQRCQTAR